jgi:hypothetical protein
MVNNELKRIRKEGIITLSIYYSGVRFGGAMENNTRINVYVVTTTPLCSVIVVNDLDICSGGGTQ